MRCRWHRLFGPAILAACAVFATTSSGRAGLIGDQVDLKSLYPDTSTVQLDAGTAVVSPGVEYGASSFADRQGSFTMDITDSQIILQWLPDTSASFLTAAFNGFELSFLSGSVSGASLDASSTFDPVSIMLNGEDLFMNYEGVTVNPGELSVIDVGAPVTGQVPEPGSLSLLGGGLVMLGLGSRRKFRVRQTNRVRVQDIGMSQADKMRLRRPYYFDQYRAALAAKGFARA